MGNKQWYEILNQAYGVDWELGKGFQWVNMTRWYGLSLDEVQDTITRYEQGHTLLTLSEQQVRYVVDRYGLRQVAERVAREMDSRQRVYTVNLKQEGVKW